MQLRDYQRRTLDLTYQYLRENPGKNPCIVLPTAAGKSVVIATFIKETLQHHPDMRVLMLTHVKELIAQNAAELRQLWPAAPMGIYSASLGRRELGERITFAGIQSVRKRAASLGFVHVVFVDECHLIGHKDEGGYRELIAALKLINPSLRVIGLTATPWRLGHGVITDKPALFDDLIEPTSILELVEQGYLCPLSSKDTALHFDVSKVKKRGGEFVESELAKAVDTNDQNEKAVRETIARGMDRNHWLVFCVGIQHAEHVAALLNEYGVSAQVLTGKHTKAQREKIISDYKAGAFKALVNVEILTTGFNFPAIDLIALLRPTLSPVLYIQICGRGMRLHPSKEDCKVFDFANLIRTHGPITAVQPPKKKGSAKGGEAPVKVCPECAELMHTSAKHCPSCGFEFPPPEEKEFHLSNDDIMGLEGTTMVVKKWRWTIHSKQDGRSMLRADYYGENFSDPVVSEYLVTHHPGSAGEFAWSKLQRLAKKSGALVVRDLSLDSVAMEQSEPPSTIEYRKDGKFFKILRRKWEKKQMPLQMTH